jgi:hypothetical protein
MLTLIPISVRDATAFVARVHRHHDPPRGVIFAVAVAEGGTVRAVAMVGRPVARMLQDEWTAEVTRVASDGAKNACSMLYAACWRACRAMGYRKLLTYTLAEEHGTSVAAAGFRCVGEAGGGSWSREGRPRVDHHPTQGKLRWERTGGAPP